MNGIDERDYTAVPVVASLSKTVTMMTKMRMMRKDKSSSREARRGGLVSAMTG